MKKSRNPKIRIKVIVCRVCFKNIDIDYQADWGLVVYGADICEDCARKVKAIMAGKNPAKEVSDE